MSSSIECICGNIIYTGSFPNDYVYDLVSEKSYDDMPEDFNQKDVERLLSGNKKLLECSVCERLIILYRGEIKYYKLEDEDD